MDNDGREGERMRHTHVLEEDAQHHTKFRYHNQTFIDFIFGEHILITDILDFSHEIMETVNFVT